MYSKCRYLPLNSVSLKNVLNKKSNKNIASTLIKEKNHQINKNKTKYLIVSRNQRHSKLNYSEKYDF